MSDRNARVRKRIQDQMDQKEAELKRDLFRRRLELARTGIKSYEENRVTDAVKAFHTYLKILEDWKGVPEGALTPKNFDPKKDIAELLLVSGVYWDLAKIYDRTKSPDKVRDFHHYLEKFVQFSRNTPYQGVSAETLRKYMATGRAMRKEAFGSAYKNLAVTQCFIATSLVDVTGLETLERLRIFRDRRLVRSSAGRAFVTAYYRWGPAAAGVMNCLPRPARVAAGLLLRGLTRMLPKDPA